MRKNRPSEVELKYRLLNPTLQSDIVRDDRWDGYLLSPIGEGRYFDIYCDTVQREILASGHTLRLRRQAANGWQLTLKNGTDPVGGALHNRLELEANLEPALWPRKSEKGAPMLPTLQAVMQLFGAEAPSEISRLSTEDNEIPLDLLLIIRQVRNKWRLFHVESSTEGELSLDLVRGFAPEAGLFLPQEPEPASGLSPFYELEIEAIDAEFDLEAVAERLRDEASLVVSRSSKALTVLKQIEEGIA